MDLVHYKAIEQNFKSLQRTINAQVGKKLPDDNYDIRMIGLLNKLDVCIDQLSKDESNKQTQETTAIFDYPRKKSTTSQNSEDTIIPINVFNEVKFNFFKRLHRRKGSLGSVSIASVLSTSSTIINTVLNEKDICVTGFNPDEWNLEGWLSRLNTKTSIFLLQKRWKNNYFRLKDDKLFYFKHSDKLENFKVVELTSNFKVFVTDVIKDQNYVLQLFDTKNNNSMYLKANTSDDLNHWLAALKSAINFANFTTCDLPNIPIIN